MNPRRKGTNARARGRNPRAKRTSPRNRGLAPRQLEPLFLPIPPAERPLKRRKKYSPGYLATWANRLLRSYAATTPQMKIAAIDSEIEAMKGIAAMFPACASPEHAKYREEKPRLLEVERQKIFWKIRLGIENQSQAVRVDKIEKEIRAIAAEKPRFDGLRLN